MSEQKKETKKQPSTGFEKIFKKILKKLFKKAENTVAVVKLHGVIGGHSAKGLTADGVDEIIDKIKKINKLKAIALSINSPGGSPVQSELIAIKLQQIAKEKKVLIYSFIEDVGASGGYWLACAGEEIYASKSSIIGSIGVRSAGFGFKALAEKIGVERRVYAQGKNKVVLDPFLDEKEEDVAIIKSIQKDIHEHFKNWVNSSRGEKLKGSEDELFNGLFWGGDKSLSLGLIDGIGDLDSVMKEKFGSKIKIQKIEGSKSWIKRKFGIFSADNLIDAIYNKFEEKNFWSRFGL